MDFANYWAADSGGADLGAEISNSLLFDGASHLHRTLGASISTMTISVWLKPQMDDDLGVSNSEYRGQIWKNQGNNNLFYQWDNTDQGRFQSSSTTDLSANGRYRDPHAWYHIVYQYTHSNTTHKLWINGVRVNSDQSWNAPITATEFCIGNSENSNTDAWARYQGKMAQFIMVDGTAVAPTEFGREQRDGIWVPKNYSGTYGDEGFRLDFDNASDLGEDSSGNNNDFTASGFETTALSNSNPCNDSLSQDTPTANKPVASYGPKIGRMETNSRFANVGSTYCKAQGSIAYPDTGVWQTEYYSHTGYITIFGFCTGDCNNKAASENQTGMWGIVNNGAFTANGNSTSGQVNETSNGDIWTLIMDMDNDEAKWYRNNSLEKTLSIPARNDQKYFPYFQGYQNTNEFNLGEFPFRHTPNANAKALIPENLGKLDVPDPSKHFFAKVWSGTGSTQNVDGIPFKPDLVWNKLVSPDSFHHRITDCVRGVSNTISSDTAAVADTSTTALSAFRDDGFTWNGTDFSYNQSGQSIVAWCWKAGGAPNATNTATSGAMTAGSVSLNDTLNTASGDDAYTPAGSPSKYPSKMSINTAAGFSIIEWEGTGNTITIPHGLGKTPELIMIKNLDDAQNWGVYHRYNDPTAPANFYLNLNDWNGKKDGDARFADSMPNSNVFTVGSSPETNQSGKTMIAYVWAPVRGFSAMGHTLANNSTNGPWHYTGFKPAYLTIKCHSVDQDPYYTWDNGRDSALGGNTSTGTQRKTLALESANDQEDRDNEAVEFLSNGFKIRNTSGALNYSGRAHVWWAFAEHPEGGTDAPPGTAF